MTEETYGIFGTGKVKRDYDGFIEMFAIAQESGLYCGIPPEELRIHTLCRDWDYDEVSEVVSDMNKRADLPFYVIKVQIKSLGGVKNERQ